ncbi:MAG: glycoside hydrolase domain-containing protein, partial [Rhodoplanes sp.]
KTVGTQTIIRYYDHENETIPGKTLRRQERDLIIANGFHIAVVFQHNNNKFASFTPLRGRQDAKRSLVLAAENAQPKGSAIYFGVDGGWRTAGEIANIKAYFTAVQAGLGGKGYRIGVYGSGLVCKELLQDGLAELCWLANAKSWPDYDAYFETMEWSLVQLLPADCGGRNVDFNLTRRVDYGQFTSLPVRGRPR